MDSRPKLSDAYAKIPGKIKESDEIFKQTLLDVPTIAKDIFKFSKRVPYIYLLYTITAIIGIQNIIFPNATSATTGTSFIVVGILLFLANGMVYTEVRNHFTDLPPIEATFTYTAKNMHRIILSTFSSSTLILLGFPLFFFPGLLFSVKLPFAPASVIIDENSTLDSLKASYRSTTGHFIRIQTIFGILGMLFFLTLIFSLILDPFTLIYSLYFITMAVYFPLIQITIAYLYTDMRDTDSDLILNPNQTDQ